MSANQRKTLKDRSQLRMQESIDYMNRITPELIQAEKKVDEIKNSKEWKKHYGYCQTLFNRGKLKERPTKANGYKIELGSNLLSLADIEDILTPEQIEQIKNRI